MAGLIVVDGVTVLSDPEDALSRGLVDVPLLLQTELAEMDTYENNATINNMTVAEYTAFIDGWFVAHGFPDTEKPGAVVAELYAAELATSVELGHQVFVAEYSFLCGNINLARLAGQGFESPVYASVGVHSPCNPLPVIPSNPPSKYPGHNWDLVSAIRSWDFYGIHFGSPPYSACKDDADWGDLMRKQWVTLHSSVGAGGIGFPPVNGPLLPPSATTTSSNEPPYFVGLQHATGVEVATDYKKQRCSAIASRLGLDKRFWLVN